MHLMPENALAAVFQFVTQHMTMYYLCGCMRENWTPSAHNGWCDTNQGRPVSWMQTPGCSCCTARVEQLNRSPFTGACEACRAHAIMRSVSKDINRIDPTPRQGRLPVRPDIPAAPQRSEPRSLHDKPTFSQQIDFGYKLHLRVRAPDVPLTSPAPGELPSEQHPTQEATTESHTSQAAETQVTEQYAACPADTSEQQSGACQVADEETASSIEKATAEHGKQQHPDETEDDAQYKQTQR